MGEGTHIPTAQGREALQNPRGLEGQLQGVDGYGHGCKSRLRASAECDDTVALPKTIPYDLVAATYNQIAKADHEARADREATEQPMLTTAQCAESHARRVMQRDHASKGLGDAGGMDAVFKLLSAHREFKPPAEEVARQPAHTQLECIGERVKPAAAAQGETDEEKLERVRKAVSDDIVNKGERVELMGDFDAFVAAVKAEAAVKEFPKNTGKSCATTGRSWSGEGQRKCRKRMASR